VKEEHSLPLVHLGFFFPGGRISEVGSNAGITSLMLEALLRNYIRRSGLLAASQLEALGVRLAPVVQPDFFGVQASVLSSELNEGIWELIRWLRMPEIEEDDVKWARAELLRKITLQPTRKMIDSARKAVYRDHPYGFTIEQIGENVETLGMDSVKAWKEKYLDGVNPHILALGDVQGTAFIGDLVSELSDRRYRVGTVVENDVPFPDDPEASYKVISNAEQGTAMMVFPGPEEGSDFAEMLDVALQVLGGANGLLTKSVTKELRLANDLRLFRESGVGGGAIFIEVEAAASNLEKSIQEIRRELNQFAEKLVPEPLFLSSLVTRITKHHFRRQKRADYSLEIMRSVLAGEPVDYGERYVLNVRQLRVGEVVLAVQRYMGEEE
jgi:predicted Zn-dependent peptidase